MEPKPGPPIRAAFARNGGGKAESWVGWFYEPQAGFSRRHRSGRAALQRGVLAELLWSEPALAGGTLRLQILHQPLKRRLIRIVILPVAEVGDEVLPYLARRGIANVGIIQLPLLHFLKRHQRDGKQELLVFPLLARPCVGNFRLHPLTTHTVLGEDEQQPVMQANGLVNLLVDLTASLDVVGRKPAAHAFGLQ